jgi:pimeloyl-ACP methyl ester carboxylesterase
MDSLSSVSNIKCPILLLHGKKDTYIPIKQSENLLEAISPDLKRAKLVAINRRPEASHTNYCIIHDIAAPIHVFLRDTHIY